MGSNTADDRAEGREVRDPSPDSPSSGLSDRVETVGLSGVGALINLEILSDKDALTYLRLRLGDLAPGESVFGKWSYSFWREKNRELAERLAVPLGARIPGIVGRIWRRTDLDQYVERLIVAVDAVLESEP